ncbi:MAG: lipo-like protein [Hyphomicrobiaceae bacterium]|nr:lipo-like protein [Hyphomicrobiaceae bacterium]
MTWFDTALDWIGRRLGDHLRHETPTELPFIPSDPDALRRALRPADVLLIAGGSKLSTAIKYLTQSTWSHAALYVGDVLRPEPGRNEPHVLIEVELGDGCISAPLSKYDQFHTRIARPVALTDADREEVIRFMISRLGTMYDMRNIIDLARYLLPTPPVPTRWRRRIIALGSGQPTRTICSTLIAEAFGRVRYPILPRIERIPGTKTGMSAFSRKEILHIRHHSLYAPADFDLSPYFKIVKPTIEDGFNYKGAVWAEDAVAQQHKAEEA